MLPVTRMERVISHRRQRVEKFLLAIVLTDTPTTGVQDMFHIFYFVNNSLQSECKNFHINVHFRCISKDAKTTVSSVMLIGLSVRHSFLSHGKTPLRLKGFS